VCSYSASDHNTLRRHRMRHTGQKPYRCSFCSYTAIQAISLKMHVRTKHASVTPSTVAAFATAAAAATTSVYSCQMCPYQTVNRRSWLAHLQDHRMNPPMVTDQCHNCPPSVSNESLLVFAPLVNVTHTVTSHVNVKPTATVGHLLDASQPDVADHLGLRHILTAISEKQQSTPMQTAAGYN